MLNKGIFLRLALAIVFIYHGAGKVFMGIGAFGEMFNLPYLVALLVTFAEVAGGIGILLSLFKINYSFSLIGIKFNLTRLSALAMVPVLLGAIFLVHLPNGFSFMKNGFEFQLVLLLVALHFLFSKVKD